MDSWKRSLDAGTSTISVRKENRISQLVYQQIDIWIRHYGQELAHNGKFSFWKTPMQRFIDSMLSAKLKMLNTTVQMEEVSLSD